MIIGRTIGWIFLLLAVAAGMFEVASAAMAWEYRFVALGELWYRLDATSLNGLQAGIQRYLAPWLWDNVVAPILFVPAWLVFLVPGVLFLILCRRRNRSVRR
ncbi:MAG: hypothetical protein FJX67_08080 [Alphaproteobacteria bacterium]|nr:hypothetical protein [Alphaproteobacteria bacterium]